MGDEEREESITVVHKKFSTCIIVTASQTCKFKQLEIFFFHTEGGFRSFRNRLMKKLRLRILSLPRKAAKKLCQAAQAQATMKNLLRN
jgi:hypothetical protein